MEKIEAKYIVTDSDKLSFVSCKKIESFTQSHVTKYQYLDE